MPILLTNNFSINELGLYTKYILAGAYICKLFDYWGNYNQCTPDEIQNGNVNSEYAYIGNRYDNLFPYNKLKLYYNNHPEKENIFSKKENSKSKQYKPITKPKTFGFFGGKAKGKSKGKNKSKTKSKGKSKSKGKNKSKSKGKTKN